MVKMKSGGSNEAELVDTVTHESDDALSPSVELQIVMTKDALDALSSARVQLVRSRWFDSALIVAACLFICIQSLAFDFYPGAFMTWSTSSSVLVAGGFISVVIFGYAVMSFGRLNNLIADIDLAILQNRSAVGLLYRISSRVVESPHEPVQT